MGMTEIERRAKVRELQLAYKNVYKEVARLSKIGTDTPRAKVLLLEAERAFDRRDYLEVRQNIAAAASTARDSTQTFLNMFTIEVLKVLDLLRTYGIDVSAAEPRIAAADMELHRLAFGRAARLLIKSVESILGVSPRFHDVLIELTMASYNLVLAESFGLHLAMARAQMDEAFKALMKKDFEKARWLQWQMRKEVRKGIRGYGQVFILYSSTRAAVEMGERMGADVQEARTLLDRGVESMEATHFPEARAFFEGAMDLAIRAGKDLIGEMV